MCLVLAFVLAALAWSLQEGGHTAPALLSAVGSAGFTALMLRNILIRRREKKNDH